MNNQISSLSLIPPSRELFPVLPQSPTSTNSFSDFLPFPRNKRSFQPNLRAVHLNAQHFLKSGGHYMIRVKANRTGLRIRGKVVFTCSGKKFQREFKPLQQVTIDQKPCLYYWLVPHARDSLSERRHKG